MKIFKKLTSRSRIHSAEQSLLTSIFTYAGIALLSVFVVGIVVWGIIASTGILSVIGNTRFDWRIYQAIANQNSTAFKTLGFLSIIGTLLIFLSWILRIIWIFRFDRVSKSFIYTVYTTFIIGQGVGFGLLFATWNAPDLLAIFGITGGLFAIMALVGYYAKNLRGLIPFIMVGIIALVFLMTFNMILYFIGVYSDKVTFMILMLSGVLALAYIAFDVWWIKRTNETYGQASFLDKDDRFRLVAFFAFQLLTDFIWLLWMIVRMYGRIRK